MSLYMYKRLYIYVNAMIGLNDEWNRDMWWDEFNQKKVNTKDDIIIEF